MHAKMLRKHALAWRFDFHKYKANTKAQTAISHKKLMLRDVYWISWISLLREFLPQIARVLLMKVTFLQENRSESSQVDTPFIYFLLFKIVLFFIFLFYFSSPPPTSPGSSHLPSHPELLPSCLSIENKEADKNWTVRDGHAHTHAEWFSLAGRKKPRSCKVWHHCGEQADGKDWDRMRFMSCGERQIWRGKGCEEGADLELLFATQDTVSSSPGMPPRSSLSPWPYHSHGLCWCSWSTVTTKGCMNVWNWDHHIWLCGWQKAMPSLAWDTTWDHVVVQT